MQIPVFAQFITVDVCVRIYPGLCYGIQERICGCIVFYVYLRYLIGGACLCLSVYMRSAILSSRRSEGLQAHTCLCNRVQTHLRLVCVLHRRAMIAVLLRTVARNAD